MATYYIPRKTKVKTVFVKGLTSSDLIWLVFGAIVAAVFVFAGEMVFYLLALVVALFVLIGMGKSADGSRVYESIPGYFRFMAYGKKFSKRSEKGYEDITKIVPYSAITDDKFINYGDSYYAGVIEVMPVEFGLLGKEAQAMLINGFSNALRRVSRNLSGSLVAFEKPLTFDKYIDKEISKYEEMIENVKRGTLNDEELAAREIIFSERGALLEYMNEEEHVYKTVYYLVVYGSKKPELDIAVDGITNSLSSSLGTRRLTGRDLYIFLRANYDKYFDEREYDKTPFEDRIKWTMPDNVKFKMNKQLINDKAKVTMTIIDYPISVSNAWGYSLFNLEDGKTVMNFYQVDKMMAEKQIDRAIMEMRSNINSGKGKESQKIEFQQQLQTIENLLQELKGNNEQMFNVKIHITTSWKNKGEVGIRLNELGFKYSYLGGKQIDAFISSNISKEDKFDSIERGITTTALAASFPFISDLLQDENGVMLGSNSQPVFVDFFARSNARVNSNMIIIGKSGSGKSFSTKSILSHLAADNTKIYICDPEKEYTGMAKQLHGNSIDVGNAGNGRFNPFHIYPAMLDDDDSGEEFDDSFEGHLRFLESFFKIVMEGIRSDALEALNGLITKLYNLKGINKSTDFAKVKPEQFPVFDELYRLAKQSYDSSTDEFSKINFRVLITYLEKFAEGGRYSGLWNGPTSIRTDENFFVFNFMTLLANKNAVVANAQMLLVFKYLDGEIIKNREYNVKNHCKRKIVVVVDEAHVFIDEQKPIALDFMFQMAKRIRKYDGMQIVITQNVKDFVGSPLIAKKSAAIINASQYSLIFPLAPNDMTDLVTLYKSAGGINKSEQEAIISAPRGQCFFIYTAVARSTITIETSDEIRKLFE
jgi:hypothetical protein